MQSLKRTFSKEQIRALAKVQPIPANPQFVYETEVKAKYLYNGLKIGRRYACKHL